MFTQFFGNYLLNKGIVSAAKLQEAMASMHATHVKLGVLSVNSGYMSAEQAAEVHQLQMRMDKRFGEIAVERGYMTEDQVSSLLSQQKESHMQLSQALIDQGTLTLQQFSDALQRYKDEHYLSDEQFATIKNGDIDALLAAELHLGDSKVQALAQNYLSLLAKNVIRFIDSNVYLELNKETTAAHTYEWSVSQVIRGEASFVTALGMNDQALLRIASAYAEESIPEVNELAKDAAGEFLNLHNGLFLVNMSNLGVEMELEPQAVRQQAGIAAHGDLVICTVHVSGTSFDIVLAAT